MRILVVDDNEDVADSLSMLLRMDGHEVRTEYRGANAVNTAAEFSPEVILSDIGMPEIDGYEVARRLREEPRCAGATLIALTAWARPGDRELSREAGFDHHLAKPADPAEVRQLIRSMDGRHNGQPNY